MLTKTRSWPSRPRPRTKIVVITFFRAQRPRVKCYNNNFSPWLWSWRSISVDLQAESQGPASISTINSGPACIQGPASISTINSGTACIQGPASISTINSGPACIQGFMVTDQLFHSSLCWQVRMIDSCLSVRLQELVVLSLNAHLHLWDATTFTQVSSLC